MLFVVLCLFVVSGSLFDARCLMLVVCCVMCDVFCSMCVVCCVLGGLWCALCVVCFVFCVLVFSAFGVRCWCLVFVV